MLESGMESRPAHRRPVRLSHTALAEPDIVVPSQWNAQHERGMSPERRLLAAVLTDALDDLRRFAGYRNAAGIMRTEVWKGWRRWSEAQAWLADGDRADTFGARPICDVLGIDYDAMVTALAARDWVPGGDPARRVVLRTPAESPAREAPAL